MYTHENWRKFKKEFSLKNKDIADIIGTSEQNIKQLISSSKDLPTWARGMLWVYHQQPIEELVKEAKDFIADETGLDNEPVYPYIGLQHFNCGCKIIDNLFRRHADCKLSKEEHKF